MASTASIQQQINPPMVRNTLDMSDVAVAKQDKAIDSNAAPEINFGDLMRESAEEIKKEREAKKKGDFSNSTEENFLNDLADATKIKPTAKNDLGKEDFLKLFVAQLQHQDPLNPDDGAEMAAKLAQFNGVEQMINANKKLEDLLASQNNANNQQMINYLGKEVSVENGHINVTGAKPMEIRFSTEAEVPRGTIEVKDSSGTVVGQIPMEKVVRGQNTIKWTPMGQNGDTLPNGVYSFSLMTEDTNGEMSPVKITTNAKVTGVDLKDGKTLRSNMGDIKMDEVQSIKLIEESGSTNSIPVGALESLKQGEQAPLSVAPSEVEQASTDTTAPQTDDASAAS
jgi:flagellar basal-body rod modification protein FlgD